jgi:hypothetical protein
MIAAREIEVRWEKNGRNVLHGVQTGDPTDLHLICFEERIVKGNVMAMASGEYFPATRSLRICETEESETPSCQQTHERCLGPLATGVFF